VASQQKQVMIRRKAERAEKRAAQTNRKNITNPTRLAVSKTARTAFVVAFLFPELHGY
jgi:hypothetical protein